MRTTWKPLSNETKRGNSVESSRFFVWQSTMSEDEKVVLKDKLDFNAGLVFFEGHPFSGVCVDYFTGAGGTTYTDEKKMETYYKNGVCYAITRKCLLEKNSIRGDKCFPLIINEKTVNL